MTRLPTRSTPRGADAGTTGTFPARPLLWVHSDQPDEPRCPARRRTHSDDRARPRSAATAERATHPQRRNRPATTQIYYRVTWARKREAIERLAPLTMDKEGRRVGFHASLVESERLREEIGRIPVPLGYCTEQHNVRALGAHCPFSHQCLGCEHFRTDPSHLPDLYAYLERLLETRERLRAAVPQLAEWVAHEGDPSRCGDPHRSHPDQRGRRRARGDRARRAGEAARTVPRAARDPRADGRHDRDRARRRAPESGADVHAARVHATAIGATDPERDGRCMTDHAASMTAAKRRVNTEKRERVKAVIAQIRDQGREDHLKATITARRAGVHRSFVSNHFSGQLAHAKAEIQSRFIAGLSGQTGSAPRRSGSRWKPPSTKPGKHNKRSAA
jgi:hypothetical protein